MQVTYLVILTVAITLFFAIVAHGNDINSREDNKCGENMFWELNDEGTILTISGTGYMNNYTRSKSPWYGNRSSIRSIVIGEGVVSIGNWALYQCEKMTDVKFPDSLELIGENAFAYCSTMTNIAIGNSVKSIMSRAFYCCNKLVSVSLGTNLMFIKDDAFQECPSLTSIEVEENNTKFSAIDGVLFSDNNTILVHYPAAKADASYTIPDGTKKIENYAFYKSHNLTSVTFSDGITSIGNSAFYFCDNLVNITLPDTTTSIGMNAFSNCRSLVNLKFSKRLERIGDGAFSGCRNLTSILIPKSLKRIDYIALATGSKYLTSIDVEDGNEYFKSIDGVLFNHNITELVQYPPGKTDIVNYIIPDSVNTIRASAFEDSQLMNVTIPSGVEELANFVFRYCRNLTCVIIPEGVKSIGSDTFCDCTNLGNVTIPESMESMYNNSFEKCSNLKSIFYQGYTPMSLTYFKPLTSLTDVCTPPGYTSDTFCGVNVTPSSETCKMYRSFFSQCGRGSCVDGVVVEVKWDNVTAWEQQTNECAEFRCDGLTGDFISWWNCNTSNEASRVCVNGQCIKYNDIHDGWFVELDMNNLIISEVNKSDFLHIVSISSGVTNMNVGTEVDDKGNVLRIIVYVKDETTANTVAKTVKDLKEGQNYEIFRKAVNVHVKCNIAQLSNSHQIVVNVLLLFMTGMIELLSRMY